MSYRGLTVGELLLRLRCRGCVQTPKTVCLETGPELTARGRLRRVALRGPDQEDPGHSHVRHFKLQA